MITVFFVSIASAVLGLLISCGNMWLVAKGSIHGFILLHLIGAVLWTMGVLAGLVSGIICLVDYIKS